MKYIVALMAPAFVCGTLEVEAEDEDEARDLAMEKVNDVDWEIDHVVEDHVEVTSSSEAE